MGTQVVIVGNDCIFEISGDSKAAIAIVKKWGEFDKDMNIWFIPFMPGGFGKLQSLVTNGVMGGDISEVRDEDGEMISVAVPEKYREKREKTSIFHSGYFG